MSVNDGGPAFPVTENEKQMLITRPGMTLRDYFAAAALTGCMTGAGEDGVTDRDAPMIAEYCYRLADALLAERGRKG